MAQHVAEVMDVWRVAAQRLFHVGDGRQHLIGDRDAFRSTAGQFEIVGGKHGDRLALIPHAVDRQHRLIGNFESICLPPRDIRRHEDGVHAGAAKRAGDVN